MEAYQKIFITHAEVDQWLTQLAEGKDVVLKYHK